MQKNMEEEKTTPVEIEINKESAAAWILTEQYNENRKKGMQKDMEQEGGTTTTTVAKLKPYIKK